MKAASLACTAALALAGCGEAGGATGRSAASLSTIDCSLDGAGAFAADCSMERAQEDGASVVIVRHPDGAFRRFELGVAGRGLVTADGAQQAEVTDRGDHVEVRVGSDRYLLPVSR